MLFSLSTKPLNPPRLRDSGVSFTASAWSVSESKRMETKYVNAYCPKLEERVLLTATRLDPTLELVNPPFRFKDCDSKLECGIVKGKGITPEWSRCPFNESTFVEIVHQRLLTTSCKSLNQIDVWGFFPLTLPVFRLICLIG